MQQFRPLPSIKHLNNSIDNMGGKEDVAFLEPKYLAGEGSTADPQQYDALERDFREVRSRPHHEFCTLLPRWHAFNAAVSTHGGREGLQQPWGIAGREAVCERPGGAGI